MDSNAPLPHKLPDLSEEMRRFLAGVREDEIQNLKVLVELDSDERAALAFLVRRFSLDDLTVLIDSLENLRVMKRFGRFGMWFFAAIIAGAGAAAGIKALFSLGATK